MISRTWHGYTHSGNAESYEALRRDEIITGIEDVRSTGSERSKCSDATSATKWSS